jgi:hypothetical protein
LTTPSKTRVAQIWGNGRYAADGDGGSSPSEDSMRGEERSAMRLKRSKLRTFCALMHLEQLNAVAISGSSDPPSLSLGSLFVDQVLDAYAPVARFAEQSSSLYSCSYGLMNVLQSYLGYPILAP